MTKTLTEQIVDIQNQLDCLYRDTERLDDADKKIDRLVKQLAIATKALEEINKNYRFTVAQDVVYKALKEIKEVK